MRLSLCSNSVSRRSAAILALGALVAGVAAAGTPVLVKTINLGAQSPFVGPQRMAVNPGTNRAYLFNGAQIGIVDTSSGTFNGVLQPVLANGGSFVAPSDRRPSVNGFAVNPATNKVYAAFMGATASTLLIIDAASDTIVQTVNIAGPVANIAINSATNKLYVMQGAPTAATQILVLNGNTLAQTASIAGVEAGPLVVNSADNKIYAPLPGPAFGVAIINGVSDTISGVVSLPVDTFDLIVDPVSNNVYAKQPFLANSPVYKIDGTTDQLASTINAPAAPAAGFDAVFNYVDTAGNKIYSGLAIDGVTDAVLQGFPGFHGTTALPPPPSCFPLVGAADFSLGNVYGGCGTNLLIADAATGSLKATPQVNVPMNWNYIVVNSANHAVYVLNNGNMAIVDPLSGTVSIITFASGPTAVAANPVTNQVYVVDLLKSSVLVIDGATNNVTATVPVRTATGAVFVAVNKAKNQYVVAGASDGLVFDGVTNAPIVAISPNPFVVGNAAFTSMVVNEVTNKLYSTTLGSVLVTDLATGKVSLLANPVLKTGEICTVRSLTVNSALNWVYGVVQCKLASAVVFIWDGTTGANLQQIDLGADIPFGANAVEIALNPKSNKLYIANYGGFSINNQVPLPSSVEVYNAITITHVASVPNVAGPLVVDSVLNAIYGTNRLAPGGAVIDGSTDTLNSLIPLTFAVSGVQGMPIGVNEATNMVYFLNPAGAVNIYQGNLPSPGSFSVSGQLSGSGAAGVTITAQGGQKFTAVTDAAGVFSLSGLSGGAYVVTPTTPGLFYSPASQSINIATANVTGVNFAALSSPIAVKSLTLAPYSTIASGVTTNATVTINQPAPAGGVVLNLSANNKAIKAPATITVTAGATSATFALQASGVNTPTPVTIVATYQGSLAAAPSSASVVLTVSPGDTLHIQSATFSKSTQLLKVTASSTNPQAILTLFLSAGNVNLGTFANNGGGSFSIQVSFTTGTPASVNAKSNLGGSTGQGVTVTP
jgi:YVTN family beta-propeller protein